MFSSTDARSVRGGLGICVMSLAALFFAGCANQQRAIELYVDAVMLTELDESEKAIEKLESSVRFNRRFSLAHSLLGEIYQQMADYEKSAASYEKAAELNPWSFRDYFNLGRVYQVMRKFAQAVKAYAKACELRPDHLQAHINAAQSYYQIKDYDNALAYGQRAEQIDPNLTGIQKLLGDIYESQKDYDQAIASYKRALEADSSNPEIKLSLAVVYLRAGREKAAEGLLKSVVQVQPDNNSAYQYLGYCYLLFHQQAVESYERGRTDSNTPEVEASLAQYLDKAIESYSRAIEINDKDWQAFKGRGVAYMLKALSTEDQQLKEKAVEQWRISLEYKPDQRRHKRLRKLIRKYSKQDK